MPMSMSMSKSTSRSRCDSSCSVGERGACGGVPCSRASSDEGASAGLSLPTVRPLSEWPDGGATTGVLERQGGENKLPPPGALPLGESKPLPLLVPLPPPLLVPLSLPLPVLSLPKVRPLSERPDGGATTGVLARQGGESKPVLVPPPLLPRGDLAVAVGWPERPASAALPLCAVAAAAGLVSTAAGRYVMLVGATATDALTAFTACRGVARLRPPPPAVGREAAPASEGCAAWSTAHATASPCHRAWRYLFRWRA